MFKRQALLCWWNRGDNIEGRWCVGFTAVLGVVIKGRAGVNEFCPPE